jgi:histidyl-tRNA synthetase
MSKSIQSIRGMHDILPNESARWQQVEAVMRELMAAYGYQEIRVPIVERTELFARSIGEVTDIVEKEMYSFEDRNGDSLSLRPECTASCVRAGVQHGLIGTQTQRLWYLGPMFRHERPQKGRYRQFHQFGVETFGFEGPDIDAELILIAARLWRRLGLEGLTLEINSLGTTAARAAYRDLLVEYLRDHASVLDEDSLRRLETNPLRVLDSKNPDMAAVIQAAPSLLDHLDTESREHFDRLQRLLTANALEFRVNPRLVRGLDYYSRTVFEWLSEDLGAQATVCAGGRYDALIEQLGGRATFAAGFAVGMERLMDLIAELPSLDNDAPHAYLITAGTEAELAGSVLAEKLRNALPKLRLVLNCGGGSLKSQMRRANNSGATLALILGASELQDDVVGVKYLRAEKPQETVARASVVPHLATSLGWSDPAGSN